MMIRYFLYRNLMKLTHKYNWHYMRPLYPDGDTMLRCDWCGISVIVERINRSADTISGCCDNTIKRI